MELVNSFPANSNSIPNTLNEGAAKDLAQKIWADCIEVIKTRVNTQNFKAWFEPIRPVLYEHKKILLEVPSQFFSEWLEEHYFSLINEILTQAAGMELTIEYVINPEERDIYPNEDHYIALELYEPSGENNSQKGPDITGRNPVRSSHETVAEPSLNPRYTFENYIKGESNQFARAAALAVANNPGGKSFNPLVIYGGVGLGKTHLIHAIGNSLIASGKTKRVLYVSSEKFTVDFVEAIQKDKVGEFSNKYRSVDVLIVDDIQFFAGKEKTQDVFFHTFNALFHLGKQIVLSCDKPPKDLKGMNDRLISRFQSGLTADVQLPDLETRIAILLKKSQDDGFDLSHEIVEFIAANVTSNIRELEGCLISLLARASLENRTIDLKLAKEVVRALVGEVRSHITIEEIQQTVCQELQLPPDLLRAKTRKQEIVNARQIAMYLSKELTSSSLKTIGLHFGGRDHSTVIHAYQCIEDAIKTDPKQKSIVQHLRSKLELGVIRM